MHYRCLWALAAFLSCAHAQDLQTTDIKGAVHSDQEIFFQGYTVEVSASVQHQTWRTDILSDGSFVLRELPRGDYLLRIVGRTGGVLKEEYVSANEHMTAVEVNLPRQQPTAPGGPISIRELRNPPSAKAVRAAAAAQRFAHDGAPARAVSELQKAIRLSPDYAAAHSNLGAEYIRLKNYEAARREITKALEIAGPNAVDLCNLAFLDTAEYHFADALQEVRAAIRADPANGNAHYVLGALLTMDNRTKAEGIRELQTAAQTVPGAREMLAHLGH